MDEGNADDPNPRGDSPSAKRGFGNLGGRREVEVEGRKCETYLSDYRKRALEVWDSRRNGNLWGSSK